MGGFSKPTDSFQNPWVGFDFLNKFLKKITQKNCTWISLFLKPTRVSSQLTSCRNFWRKFLWEFSRKSHSTVGFQNPSMCFEKPPLGFQEMRNLCAIFFGVMFFENLLRKSKSTHGFSRIHQNASLGIQNPLVGFGLRTHPCVFQSPPLDFQNILIHPCVFKSSAKSRDGCWVDFYFCCNNQ